MLKSRNEYLRKRQELDNHDDKRIITKGRSSGYSTHKAYSMAEKLILLTMYKKGMIK